ncbi:MAG: hypothetical protein KC668_30325, partial [Myxococcales bacterium]|nr:hypothetical protein [Myxococcales bacterium]
MVLGVTGCGTSALRRAETAHIRLTTDEPSRYAQRFAAEMERTRSAFVDTFFQCAEVGDADPLDVVAFREVDAFERYMAHRWDVEDVHGFVTTRPQRLVERPPALALRTRPSDALRLFRHELTHRLVARCTPQAPAWMDEGLAEVLETANVRDGALHVGTPPYFFHDLGVDAAHVGGTVTEYVPRGALLTIDALRSLPRGAMVVAGDRMATRARYASAWALVAVLTTGPDEAKVAFAAYRRALRTGASPDRAWTENLAQLPLDDLYASFIDSDERWLVSYAVTGVANVQPEVRVLSDRERDLFWARDLPWDTAEGREQALSHLDDLVRRDPGAASDPEVVTLRAAILLEGGDLQRAASGLAAAPPSGQVAFARLALSVAIDPL